MRWVAIAICSVFLVVSVAASGLYFSRGEEEKRPFLLGMAALSAACGVGVGFSSEMTFSILVPVLAAAYGGALVCAVRYRPSAAEDSSDIILGKASAASGIPLMLGAYFANSISNFWVWYPDVRRVAAALLILAIVIILSSLLGLRGRKEVRGVRSHTSQQPERMSSLAIAGASFGGFIGLVTGLSTQPVVVYVAPAALALFAGTASCFFAATGLDSEREQRSIATVLFSFGLLVMVSLLLGIAVRMKLNWGDVPRIGFGFFTLAILAAVVGFLVDRDTDQSIKGLAFSFLGAGVGLAIGLSQTFVLHVAIPTLLAVFAGLAGYVFATGEKRRNQSMTLLAVFCVVLLLGGFVGYSLRDGDTGVYLADGPDWPGPPSETPPHDLQDPTSGVLAELDAHPDLLIWLEGQQSSSAIVVLVTTDWAWTVEIRDRVNDPLPMYDGIPDPATPVRAQGESLEISWPTEADESALRILGWEQLVQRDGGWTVQGDPDEIDTSTATQRGGRYVLVYPPT